jgi:predicted ATP-grasp superfamily ATP-dependent carboligase
MRVFIDEFLTSGGLLTRSDWQDCDSLLREGRAMAQAIAADVVRIEAVEVQIKLDARLAEVPFPGCQVIEVRDRREDRSQFRDLAATADWTFVIAPEIDGMLLDRCQHAVAAGGRLLGPGLACIELASDKHRTAEFLAQHGVPVPPGIPLAVGDRLPPDFGFPAVLKPRDGAGSLDVRLIANSREGARMCVDRPSRLEQYCEGLPCSVSVLCGSAEVLALPPFIQLLSRDGQFRYLGGERLRDPLLIERAQRLALRAAQCLPQARGYLGFDLILGPARDGSCDRVIEINPRLTTSYLGLRQCTESNLAAAILASAMGLPLQVDLVDRAVAFRADGTVRSDFDNGTTAT